MSLLIMTEDYRQRGLDRRGYPRSPVTLSEYRKGKPNPMKGRANPAESLTKSEYRLLLSSFKPIHYGVRDKAIVMLMYTGMKCGAILKLQRRHYEPGRPTLTVPATQFRGETDITLDLETREAMDEWMEVRRELRKQHRIQVSSPLFCTLSGPTRGLELGGAYVRQMLKRQAAEVEIDRKVNPQGLLLSGIEHRAETHSRLLEQLLPTVEEADFESRYREAFETWEAAAGKFELDPVREARRIGEDCRAALDHFADAALRARRVEPPAGTVSKLRALLDDAEAKSLGVAAHHDALIKYWGTVSDLDQRQAHKGKREAEKLTREDARRAVLYTLLVMLEVDRALAVQ
jgi:hypothetical protein